MPKPVQLTPEQHEFVTSLLEEKQKEYADKDTEWGDALVDIVEAILNKFDGAIE